MKTERNAWKGIGACALLPFPRAPNRMLVSGKEAANRASASPAFLSFSTMDCGSMSARISSAYRSSLRARRMVDSRLRFVISCGMIYGNVHHS